MECFHAGRQFRAAPPRASQAQGQCNGRCMERRCHQGSHSLHRIMPATRAPCVAGPARWGVRRFAAGPAQWGVQTATRAPLLVMVLVSGHADGHAHVPCPWPHAPWPIACAMAHRMRPYTAKVWRSILKQHLFTQVEFTLIFPTTRTIPGGRQTSAYISGRDGE